MAEQAKVTSFEALETFRSHLILFLNKARLRVDEVADEVRRTRGWLQSEQRLHWEGEIRRRRRTLSQAEQELLNARLSSFRDNLTREMLAVRRAKESVSEAESKLQRVKQWGRNYESSVAPLARKLEGLRGLLDHEMPEAVATLLQTQLALEAYAETAAPRTLGTPPPAAEKEETP